MTYMCELASPTSGNIISMAVPAHRQHGTTVALGALQEQLDVSTAASASAAANVSVAAQVLLG
jgi:hypothetical protein